MVCCEKPLSSVDFCSHAVGRRDLGDYYHFRHLLRCSIIFLISLCLKMNHKALHSSQRVGIFIDTQNLYHSARTKYNAHVNYKSLVEHAVGKRQLVRAFAYVIRSETHEESKFIDALAELGIEIREKDLQVFYSGEKKADWDVGIAIDIVRMNEKLDVIVLVSGDGDFTEVLKYVRSRGLRAEVMAFKKTTSKTLLTEADSYIDLGEDPARFLIPTSKAPGKIRRKGYKPRKLIVRGKKIDQRDVKTSASSAINKTSKPGLKKINKP